MGDDDRSANFPRRQPGIDVIQPLVPLLYRQESSPLLNNYGAVSNVIITWWS